MWNFSHIIITKNFDKWVATGESETACYGRQNFSNRITIRSQSSGRAAIPPLKNCVSHYTYVKKIRSKEVKNLWYNDALGRVGVPNSDVT